MKDYSMKNFFTKALGQKILTVSNVSGGDINDAYKVKTESTIYFAKVNSEALAKEMFEKEALGLKLLKEKAKINIPEVSSTGKIDDKCYLILNWIDNSKYTVNTDQNLARQLATLHNTSDEYFGLEYDNFIGTLIQKNIQNKNWLDFYFSNRIEYQLRMSVNSNLISKTYIAKAENMFSIIEKDYPDATPSLLHGDLWSGNYMVNSYGKAIFIDPAVYFGYREMDIAMMKLFGGFNNRVFELYDELFPLDHDWQSRIRFHQLYYILVHVNLFGGSYARSAQSIIDYYS